MHYKKISLYVLFLISALLALSGCESCGDRCLGANRFIVEVPQAQLSSEMQREFNTPLYCTGEQQCQQMMMRATEFVRMHSDFPIVSNTDSLIETTRPTHLTQQLHFRITRQSLGNGQYQLLTSAGCTSPEGCSPNDRLTIALAKLYMQTGLEYSAQMLSATHWGMRNPVAANYAAQLEQLAKQDMRQLLSSARTVNCRLDEATKAQLIYQVLPEQLAQDRGKLAAEQIEHLGDSVNVVEGNCANGRLDGSFSARFTQNRRMHYPNAVTDQSYFGRVDGHMRRGRLQGEVRVVREEISMNQGERTAWSLFTMGVYDNGLKTGTHVAYRPRQYVASTELASRLEVIEVLDNGVHRVHVWSDGDAASRHYTLNGEMEGWLDFASPVMRGTRLCHKAGVRQATDEHCYLTAPGLEQGMVASPAGTVATLPSAMPSTPVTATPVAPVVQPSIAPGVAVSTGGTGAAPSTAVQDNFRDVILYREDRILNSGAAYRISWKGERLGALSNGSALRIRLPPGSQTLTIGYGLSEFEQPVVIAEQGETYFFARMKFSVSDNPSTHMRIEPVAPAAGRIAVSTLRN